MMDVLQRYPMAVITGANGWLGRRVVLAFQAAAPNVKIRALVAPHEDTNYLRGLGVECVPGDITDADARASLLQGAEGAVLLHVAGIIHPHKFVADLDRVNHLGTLALHQDAIKARVRRMVVMSSNSPLGANKTPEDVFTEDSPYHPYMGYGRSKMKMELGLRAASKRVQVPDVVIVRAPWFYGPGQPARQTLFFTMIKNGKFPLMGEGLNRRSMGYVDSLAQGILLAAVSAHAAGRIYWLADERAYSMQEIVGTVKAVLRDDFGMKVAEKDWMLPPVVSDIARVVDASLQSVGLYHQKIHVLSEMNLTIACSIERAKKELKYQPLVELREGMRNSVKWCLDNGQTI